MLFVTENDVRVVLRGAISHSASKLGIPVDESDLRATYDRIRKTDPVIFHALQNFLESYAAWHRTHVEIDESGSAGQLDAKQSTDLLRRIDDKKAAAETLAALLAGA